MKRMTIQVGSFEVNCSILSENGTAWIVDPGNEGERIVNLLRKEGLVPAGILLTHAHFDHIGAIPVLQQAFPDLPVFVSDADRAMFGHPMNQLPPDYPSIGKPKGLSALSELRGLRGLETLEVIETPGHTPGGVCYHFVQEKLLLSGDTLFAGSVGRTDLPGGDMATLMDSLKKLTVLPDDTLVIPGHGSTTSIAAEKSGNPFLR